MSLHPYHAALPQQEIRGYGHVRLAIEIMMLLSSLALGAFAIAGWRREGQSVVAGLGLRLDRGTLPDLLVGAGIAGIAMVGIHASERALGGIATTHAAGAVAPLAGVAAGMLLTAFKEELLMRGMMLSGLLRLLGGRAAPAIAISALAFGLIHLSNPSASALSVLGNTLGGVVYGLAFVLTGRLWLPIGLHFAWNFVQGPILGFPVSGIAEGGLLKVHDLGPAWMTGGGYGPEGGAVGIGFRFVVIAGVLAWTAISVNRQRSRGTLPFPGPPVS